MSDLTATNCGCAGNSCNNGCGNGLFGGGNCCWIILLLLFCGNGFGTGFGNNNGCGCGCDNNNNGCCDWLIWILLLSCFCGGNNNGCGCNRC